MAITSTTTTRLGHVTTVTVISNLTPPVWYHWYVDGSWVGRTSSGSRQFWLADGEQARIEVADTTNPDYDPIANAPVDYPAVRTLWWLRSLETGIVEYLIEQKIGAGAWTEIARVRADETRWAYRYLTDRLTDLTTYEWRVSGVDAAGNLGTTLSVGSELIVRRPEVPNFTATFNAGPTTVTFAAA